MTPTLLRPPADGSKNFEAQLSSSHWMLDGHRLRGVPVMPAVGWLELAAEAVATHFGRLPIELSEVYFMRPLFVPEGASRQVAVELGEHKNPSSVKLRITHEGQEYVLGLGSVVLTEAPVALDLRALEVRGPDSATAPRELSFRELQYGARWNNFRAGWFSPQEALVHLELAPEYRGEADEYLLHPALLDRATVPLVAQLAAGESLPFLPFSYGRVAIYRKIPASVYSYVRSMPSKSRRGRSLKFDVTLADASGAIVADIRDFSMVQIDLDRMAEQK